MYSVESEDVYEEMLPEINKGADGWFDTSNYPESSAIPQH